MVNPFGFIKDGLSAGIDQWNDKPFEWEQVLPRTVSGMQTSWVSIPFSAL